MLHARSTCHPPQILNCKTLTLPCRPQFDSDCDPNDIPPWLPPSQAYLAVLCGPPLDNSAPGTPAAQGYVSSAANAHLPRIDFALQTRVQ